MTPGAPPARAQRAGAGRQRRDSGEHGRVRAPGGRPVAGLLTRGPVGWGGGFPVSAVSLADGSALARVTFGTGVGEAAFDLGGKPVKVTRPAGELGAWLRAATAGRSGSPPRRARVRPAGLPPAARWPAAAAKRPGVARAGRAAVPRGRGRAGAPVAFPRRFSRPGVNRILWVAGPDQNG
jgi:hypothetical protein